MLLITVGRRIVWQDVTVKGFAIKIADSFN